MDFVYRNNLYQQFIIEKDIKTIMMWTLTYIYFNYCIILILIMIDNIDIKVIQWLFLVIYTLSL
jgi:hypothetical protein